MAAAYDDPSLGLQLLKVTCVDEIRTLRDRHHLCEHEAGQAAIRKETSRLKQRCCHYTLHAGRLAIPNDGRRMPIGTGASFCFAQAIYRARSLVHSSTETSLSLLV